MPITPTRVPSRARNPKKDLPPFRKKDFSGFSPEPFPGAITAAVITTATTTLIIIITAIAATATGGTLIRVKAFPSGEIFQKVSVSTFL